MYFLHTGIQKSHGSDPWEKVKKQVRVYHCLNLLYGETLQGKNKEGKPK